MKSVYPSLSLLCSLLLMSSLGHAQDDGSVPDSPYTIAYSGMGTKIYLTDGEGQSSVEIPNAKGDYLAWSPDGTKLAFRKKYDDQKTWSIHTTNIDGANLKRLTYEKNKWDSAPAWSPDGKKIIFAREYKAPEGAWQAEIWIMNSDGSDMTQLKSLKGSNPYFTPDGRIVFSSEFKDKKSEISIADIDGGNIIHLTDNEAEEWHPEVSPDGGRIAFMSNRDGNYEIYVMNIDGSNQNRLTFSEVDDYFPSWSTDGSRILFSAFKEKNIYIINSDGSSLKKIISARDAVFKP
jgi:TolB protein